MAPGVDLRIVVAHGLVLFRQAVKAAFEGHNLKVVADTEDSLEAVDAAWRLHPDVVIVDADLPNGDAFTITRLVRERCPGCRVLVLVAQHDFKSLTQAFRRGANGFVAKESGLQELIKATLVVHEGGTIVPPHMLGRLLDLLMKRDQDGEAFRHLARLTPREREVLGLLSDGGDNKSIAATLVISPQTARTHIHKVLSKLDFHSRLEAAAFVIKSGIRAELGPASRDPTGSSVVEMSFRPRG